MAVEVSWGSKWVNLNDGESFRINADQTRDTTSKTFRTIKATSPVLGGDYLIHAVPEMVSETISVWVYGQDQTDVADNFWYLQQLFEQYEYQIRWTFNEYREYWTCQMAEASYVRGQVWTHNLMAQSTFTVPRYPSVDRERIG